MKDAETEDNEGRPQLRRDMDPSRSVALRMEGVRFAFSAPSEYVWRRGRGLCSAVFANEDRGADARGVVPVKVELCCTGLPPPVRPLDGIGIDWFFEEVGLDLVVVGLLPLFLRSGDEIDCWEDWLRFAPGRMPPRTLSRILFISGGIGMLWTMLTLGQSAGWIRRCSFGLGGRQHPGQPGF